MGLDPAAPSVAPRWLPVRLPRRPVRVVYGVLGLIGLVFIGQLVLAPRPGDFDPFIEYGAKVNARLAAGELWRLVTPIFVHGSILHFVFNAYALYNLGREIETFYGGRRFLLLFFFAGVCGSVASWALTRAPSVGASGAVFGLIAAEAVLLYRNRRLLGERARAGLQNIAIIATVNLALGLTPGARIDNWAHLGGLVGGLAMAWAIGPVWGLPTPDPLAAMVVAVDRHPLGARRGLLALGLGLGLAAVIVGLMR